MRGEDSSLRLTLVVSGGDTLYKVNSKELDIAYYGESREKALEGFYMLAEGAARGIVKGRGIREGETRDERLPYANLILRALEDGRKIEELFEERPIDDPSYAEIMSKGGLK